MKIPKRRAGAAIACAAVLGLCISGGAVALASESRPPATDGSNVPLSKYGENQFGLTVGTPTEADRNAGNLPDLVPATTDAGKPGFIRASDYYFPDPRSPEEAVAQTKKLLNERNELILQIVAADGTTPVGSQLAMTVSEDDTQDPE